MGIQTGRMTSSQQSRPNYARRFVFLALAIVLAVLAYTGGWHYAAGRIAESAEQAVAGLNGQGRRANCEELEVRGYPFRLGLFCRSVMYVDAPGGVALRAGAFRSAAQIYDPFRALGELDGPATLELPGLTALELRWDTLRASARLARPLPERVSVEGRAITVDPDWGRAGDGPMVTVDAGEFHMRPAGDAIDLALNFDGMLLGEELVGTASLPPLRGFADIAVEGLDRASLPASGMRGMSGTIRSASLATGPDAGATISGPFSVDEFGLIDAELELGLSGAAELAEVLGALFPDLRDEIAMSVMAVGDNARLPLIISSGDVRLGFLPLGSIPPM
jgi:hypothetical protein